VPTLACPHVAVERMASSTDRRTARASDPEQSEEGWFLSWHQRRHPGTNAVMAIPNSPRSTSVARYSKSLDLPCFTPSRTAPRNGGARPLQPIRRRLDERLVDVLIMRESARDHPVMGLSRRSRNRSGLPGTSWSLCACTIGAPSGIAPGHRPRRALGRPRPYRPIGVDDLVRPPPSPTRLGRRTLRRKRAITYAHIPAADCQQGHK
jgi:hypothetical protein